MGVGPASGVRGMYGRGHGLKTVEPKVKEESYLQQDVRGEGYVVEAGECANLGRIEPIAKREREIGRK